MKNATLSAIILVAAAIPTPAPAQGGSMPDVAYTVGSLRGMALLVPNASRMA